MENRHIQEMYFNSNLKKKKKNKNKKLFYYNLKKFIFNIIILILHDF
jgi:hypothetical protein